MYKKHIRAWDLRKHGKAIDKHVPVADLDRIRQFNPTGTFDHGRPDKLDRHAEGGIRSIVEPLSTIERWQTCQKHKPLIRYAQAIGCVPNATWLCSGSCDCDLPRSPTPPAIYADFELFLKAMKQVIARERYEWLTGRQALIPPDSIFTELVIGLAAAKAQRFEAATKAFREAAVQFQRDIDRPELTVSRICFCVSSILWGAIREEAFLKFALFMAKAALQRLGPSNPVTALLQHLQQEQSVEAQVRTWNCALDDYVLDEVNAEHWWNMAQRRWKWCSRISYIEDAVRHRDEAVEEMRMIGKLTPEMEEEAHSDVVFMSTPEKSLPG